MTTLPELISRLETLAKAATPGPWKARKSLHGNEYRTVQFDQGPQSSSLYTTSELEPADARFIVACDPQTILTLCAALKAHVSREAGE